MPRSDADARGQRCHRSAIDDAVVNQTERAADNGRGASPGRTARRRLGPAAETRPESRFDRRRGCRVVPDVGALRTWRRTNGPAIDARRCDGDEEAPVEAGIAARARAIERARAE